MQPESLHRVRGYPDPARRAFHPRALQLGWPAALLLAISILVPGCWGGPGYDAATVTGKVTIDNQPVPTGYITFSPVDSGQGPVRGEKIIDGAYRCELVPLGKHKVTFKAQSNETTTIYDAANDVQREIPVDILPPQYHQGVDAEVTAGECVRDFELTSSP